MRLGLAVFMYGFSKSDRANIKDDELEVFRDLARVWLSADEKTLAQQIETGLAEEVEHGT